MNGKNATVKSCSTCKHFRKFERLYTQLGELTIRGKDLHVSEMSLESGELSVEGEIQALIYGDKDRTKKLGFIGKLFR